MSRREAIIRVLGGLFIIAMLYVAPFLVGKVTAATRLSACLRDVPGAADIVVRLAFIPGPAEIQELSRYGRYGGSGNNIRHVVLLGVPKRNQQLLTQLYWIDEVTTGAPCDQDRK
jgi:hypothetical protein